MNEHPAGCTCRPCLTGLGKWNLHSPEARQRSRRKIRRTIPRRRNDGAS